MGPHEGERLQGSCYAAILAGMDADRFHELGALFERAIALDRAGGRGLLDDLKTRDRKLAERLSAMLDADGADSDVLVDLVKKPTDASRPLPESIGPFRILKKLGEGGMGVVYPGHRKTADFEQLLAIKRRPISAGPTAASSRPG